MKQYFRKLMLGLLTGILIFSLCAPASAADEETTIAAGQTDAEKTDNRPLGAVSDMGEHQNNPANSLPAIRDAMLSGAEMIRIPLQQTADGVFVLSAFEDLSIISNTDDAPISEKNWADIQQLRLREGTGGSTLLSDQTLVDLDTALSRYGHRVTFLLDADWEYRDALAQKIIEHELIDRCILVCRAPAKKALAWRDSLEQNLTIMVYEKTNVVFTAQAAVRTVAEAENAYLWLASSNPYGMIFQSYVTEDFAALDGVMVQCTNPNECGQRTDTDLYWEDLASRGYNLIMTDDVRGLNDFIERSDHAREELREVLAETERDWVLPDYSGLAFADYRFRYENALTAAQKAANRESSGFGQCRAAMYDLTQSIEQIVVNDPAFRSGKAGVTVTPGRIAAVVIGAAAFIILEVFIHKHREKKRGKK